MTSNTAPTATPAPEALDDAALDAAAGGVALLLPAVSAAREAARKTAPSNGVAEFQDGDDLFIKT